MTRKFVMLVWLVGLLYMARGALSQDSNQAALVVRFGDERVETYCIAFEEAEITGYELLERTGLQVDAQEVGMGASVCRVGEVGCAASNCFCECRGGSCEYWSYWRRSDGAWRYSASGASITAVRAGDVHGWSWGPGSVSEAIAPPDVSFEEVCVAGEDEAAVDQGPVTSGTAGEAQSIADEAGGVAESTAEGSGQASDAAAAVGDANGTEQVWQSYIGFALLLLFVGSLAFVVALRKRT